MLIKTEKLDGTENDNEKIHEERGSYECRVRSKEGRIVVRNLPFKNLSEDKLKQWFSDYGEIEEVKLLRKNDGKFVGCGFVQFFDVKNAAEAVNKANLKEMSGRKIIVDWAVPKNVYVENIKNIKREIKVEGESGFNNKCELSDREDDKPDIEEKLNQSFTDEYSVSGNQETDYLKYSIKNKNLKAKIPFKSNDVEEGKTIFVRNLPFSATNDDLRKCFSKYGALEYAIVCVDKLTEHSKGSGFVKFKDKSCAESCLLQNNKIIIDDNPLWLTLAVNKCNLENKKQKTIKDSRNLYLAKEGVIVAGSISAKGVSASDMTKRLEIEKWKSQMLKNLNMFISDRRLIVHNLPPSYDDSQLKALFLKYTHPKVNIAEAKVMREKKKIDGATGLGLSKEYGFVTFSTHEDALLALRNINNNPRIFSIKKRPIVSFSIESKVALNVKKKRLERSRIKLGIDVDKNDKLTKLNRKQRRFIKRRQQLIERRREAKKLRKESTKAEELGKKRKMLTDSGNGDSGNKKRKLFNTVTETMEPKEYCGIISERGKKIRQQSRFKLKIQAKIHKEQLKAEKLDRIKKNHVKLKKIKQPRQIQVKKVIQDDLKLNKLIENRKKILEGASNIKKWDEN